jgi:hypothetical protein
VVEVRIAAGLFRRHVVRRADDHAGLRQLRAGLPDLGDAEVENLDEVRVALPLDQEDVLRLHVAVHDPLVVGRRQRAADLGKDVHGARQRQDRRLVQRGPQFPPLQELHHDVRGAILHLVHVGHAEDVRMLELRRGDRLAAEPLQRLLVPREVRVERLDREALAEGDVTGEVDLAHPALAEFLLDAILVRDHLVEERVLVRTAHDQQLRRVGDAELHRIVILSVAFWTNLHRSPPAFAAPAS